MSKPTTLPTIAERVEAGAAYLDRVLPGWWGKIDLERLNLASNRSCVLGRLAVDVARRTGDASLIRAARIDGFKAWTDRPLLPIEFLDYDEAMRMGFDIYDSEMEDEDANYALLDAAWRTLITERRAS